MGAGLAGVDPLRGSTPECFRVHNTGNFSHELLAHVSYTTVCHESLSTNESVVVRFLFLTRSFACVASLFSVTFHGLYTHHPVLACSRVEIGRLD